MSASSISVKVEFPHHVKGAGALDLSYYVYPIVMITPNMASEARCERRYADFDALRSQLCASYWFCVVPPLPEKEGVSEKLTKLNPASRPQQMKDRESGLLEYRRTALKRFLLRVASHRLLGQSPLLSRFLRDDEWRECLRDPVKLPDFLSPSFADTVLAKSWSATSVYADASGQTSGTAYSRAVASQPQGASGTPGAQSQLMDSAALDATSDYINALDNSLHTLRDRFTALVTRRRATAAALADFCVAFGEVGEGEEDALLRQSIEAVREHGQEVSHATTQQADEESSKVVSTLSFYVGMCAAVAQALQYVRTGIRQVDTLNRRARDVESSLPRASPGNREQMQNNLRLITERAQRLDRELGSARQSFQDELIRFHQDKQYDLRELLKVFGELELRYAGTIKKDWDELRPLIEKLGS